MKRTFLTLVIAAASVPFVWAQAGTAAPGSGGQTAPAGQTATNPGAPGSRGTTGQTGATGQTGNMNTNNGVTGATRTNHTNMNTRAHRRSRHHSNTNVNRTNPGATTTTPPPGA